MGGNSSTLLLFSIPLFTICYIKAWQTKAQGAIPQDTGGDVPEEMIAKQGFTLKKVPDKIDAIVIGSGMGGLTTAALLAKNGKRVLVLEQHDVAGGNTHTFEEKGFEFDTGLHSVGGRIGEKTSSTRRVFDYITDNGVEWQKLGDIVDSTIFDNNGVKEKVNIPNTIPQFRQQLIDMFPEEEKGIIKFFNLVRESNVAFKHYFLIQALSPWASSIYRFFFNSKMKYFNLTTNEVMKSITSNKKLAGILTYAWGDFGEQPGRSSFALTATLIGHYHGGAYYPVGGPSVIARRIIRVIEKAGGKVLVRAPVSSILMNDKGHAYGVVVKEKCVEAPIVISTVGAPLTFNRLVPAEHQCRVLDIKDKLTNSKIASEFSLMTLFIGLKANDSVKFPTHNVWSFPSYDHQKNKEIYKKNLDAPFCGTFMSFPSAKDPEYSQRHPGKQVALVIAVGFYEHVEAYKDNRVRHRGPEYQAIKDKFQQRLLDLFLEKYPDLKDDIELTEMGTALTNDFYLGNYRGAIYGLAHTPERYQQLCLNPRTPIKNLYLSGQDVMSCGIVGAMFGGLTTASVLSTSILKRVGELLKESN